MDHSCPIKGHLLNDDRVKAVTTLLSSLYRDQWQWNATAFLGGIKLYEIRKANQLSPLSPTDLWL